MTNEYDVKNDKASPANFDAGMPVVAWYGLNTDGYEAVDLKENHVLRMFHAGEITAAPLVRQSDAQAALAAKDVEIVGLITVKDAALRMAADRLEQMQDDRKQALELRDALRKDSEMLDWLEGKTVDTVYFDDGEILDVGGKHATHLRIAIRAAIAKETTK